MLHRGALSHPYPATGVCRLLPRADVEYTPLVWRLRIREMVKMLHGCE